MGSKMTIGHNADIYQLDDPEPLIKAYEKYLEPPLAINSKSAQSEPELSDEIADLKRVNRQLLNNKIDRSVVLEALLEEAHDRFMNPSEDKIAHLFKTWGMKRIISKLRSHFR